MDTSKITQLTKNFSIDDIEKHMVYAFLKENGIALIDDDYVSTYLGGFVPNVHLLNLIAGMGVFSIDDMVSAMEMLIPSADKKINGAFFTPVYIADFIIRSISPAANAKIIDPSCGSGAFLLSIIKYLKSNYNKKTIDCIRENVYGADILEYNIHRCKLLLSILALMDGDHVEENDFNLVCCDSLKYDWSGRFDAVVGNPPYVKFQDMNDDTRDFLLHKYKTTQCGTYNLYFAFFELGLKLLSETGTLGYITPNNYFTSLAGKSLREFFQGNQCINRIVDFGSIKVFAVQTYTTITIMNKMENPCIEYARIDRSQSPVEFLANIVYTENPYSDLSAQKWRLLCGNERENISKIESSGEAIGSLFNICVGIATLKDDVYFVDPIGEDDLYYHIQKNGRNFKIEKVLTRPVVKISDMKTSTDVLNNSRRIVFPYYEKSGKVTAIPEEVMAIDYPECYGYLLSVKDVLQSRGKGKHAYTPFYAYGRTQGLNRKGVKLLTPTFSKSPRFLLDANPDSFFTNGYGVYMREEKRSLFNDSLVSAPENLDVIQKILNSYIMEYYVAKTSVSIEGGYPCYQKNFIERFTVPNLTSEDIKSLRQLHDPALIDKYLVKKYHLNLDCPKRSI